MVKTRNQKQQAQSPIIETSDADVAAIQTTSAPELDDLFESLEREVASYQQESSQAPAESEGSKDGEAEFEKIKKSITGLPKLKSVLDESTFREAEKNKHKTERQVIYDPIAVKQAAAKSKEETDSGKEWFNMPKAQITKEVQNDLLLISKRDVLDPKRHYKKQKWVAPKFFQIGEIVNDNYSANLSKKQRGTTLVNELLADDDTKKYFKRKYNEIQVAKTSGKMKDYKKRQKMRQRF